MPVLSERDDIIVITDEAHRIQYDTLAVNMRQALPNASFLGFTGTPLIEGEEQETRRVFGDYVSIYNFADSIDDGATVPLYYENRIPELQLTNENFDDELEDLLEEAELDETQEKAVAREFSQQYQLITRPEAARRDRRRPGRALRRPGVPRQGDVRRPSTRPPPCACTTWCRPSGPRTIAELEAEIETLPRAGAGAEGVPAPVDARDRHGGRGLAGPERSRRHGRARPRHRAAPAEDERRGPRHEVQGLRRPVPARVRVRHVADRLRRAVDVDDLPRQADAQPHADADDRPSQPGVPRQGQRADRRLHRRVPEPREGARDLRRRPQRRDRQPDPTDRRPPRCAWMLCWPRPRTTWRPTTSS